MPRYNSDLVPDATGRTIGEDDSRWDGKFRNLDVNGAVTGAFSALAVNNIGYSVIPPTSTPVFDAAGNSGFDMTLEDDVTTSVITGLRPGLLVAFILRQNTSGGWNFVWPSQVVGGMDIGTGPDEVSSQLFYSTPTQLIALTPGNIV